MQQTLADVLGRPVRHLRLRSASAVGAAVLAARGVGVDVVPPRRPGPLVEPRADARLDEAQRRWAAGGG
ncbi:FGGY-family carbohydrate kinase [Candidatus Blastococcus massiliensis]|uniref:FGGY-family carbohydrate kinase n=1 Tax=Candidatus Blastococcus massiliensis TaxID=1470358 RepID=UPI0004B75EEF|nr:FGGY-family carbohydrate kinase [Candidatus Blastococcus massiliensis]